jgi:hypothetical protein
LLAKHLAKLFELDLAGAGVCHGGISPKRSDSRVGELMVDPVVHTLHDGRRVKIYTNRIQGISYGGFEALLRGVVTRWVADPENVEDTAGAVREIFSALVADYELPIRSRKAMPTPTEEKKDLDAMIGAVQEAKERLSPWYRPTVLDDESVTVPKLGARLPEAMKAVAEQLLALEQVLAQIEIPIPPKGKNPGRPERDAFLRRLLDVFDERISPEYSDGVSVADRDRQHEEEAFCREICELFGVALPKRLQPIIRRLRSTTR